MLSHMSATIVSSGAPQNTFAVSCEQAQVNRFDIHVFPLQCLTVNILKFVIKIKKNTSKLGSSALDAVSGMLWYAFID